MTCHDEVELIDGSHAACVCVCVCAVQMHPQVFVIGLHLDNMFAAPVRCVLYV